MFRPTRHKNLVLSVPAMSVVRLNELSQLGETMPRLTRVGEAMTYVQAAFSEVAKGHSGCLISAYKLPSHQANSNVERINTKKN